MCLYLSSLLFPYFRNMGIPWIGDASRIWDKRLHQRAEIFGVSCNGRLSHMVHRYQNWIKGEIPPNGTFEINILGNKTWWYGDGMSRITNCHAFVWLVWRHVKVLTSKFTDISTLYSPVYTVEQQRKHQSSASVSHWDSNTSFSGAFTKQRKLTKIGSPCHDATSSSL